MDIDIELKLLAGLPIEVISVGYVHPLTLRKIAEIGEKKYYQYINTLCFDIEDLDFLDEIKDKDKIKSFDVLVSNCINNEEFKDMVINSLNLFLCDSIGFIKEYGVFFVGDIQEQRIIHRDNYEEIKSIIKEQNCIKKIEKPKAGNKIADDFMKKMEEIKNKYKKHTEKKTPSLHDLISCVAWKTKIGRNVWDLTLYEFYNAINRLQVIEEYDYTMLGIYTGNIDTKKMKVSLKELNWIKKID